MPAKLPEPGYYRSNDKDVIVLDPLKLSDTGELLTKDVDDARWQPCVAFRLAFVPGSPLYILSAKAFDGRFKPATYEAAMSRVRDAEVRESARLAEEEAAKAAPETSE